MRRFGHVFGTAIIGLLACQALPAAQAQTSASAQVAGWDELVQSVRDLPDRILAKLPEEQRNDPQIRQEVGRLALSALASSAIGALGADGDHPVFLPSIGNVLTIGQPNADTSYRSAQITPGGTYRLQGRRGSARMVRVAEAGPPPPSKDPTNLGPQRVDHDLNALPIDADGRYSVILSPTRPEGYTGAWWPLNPTSNSLMVRIVGADWAKEIDPTFSIERLDRPVPRPRPSAAQLEASLRRLVQSAEFIAPLLVDRPQKLRAAGVNTLQAIDFSSMGGLKGQFYYEGLYALKDDEALIVEARVPDKCLYRSIILTNDIYETTDWYNNHSSLNDTQAQPDKDGVLRIVVANRDPGVANWLDTAGYRTGVIQGRWTECDGQPVPTIRKVSASRLRRLLPADTKWVTPEQRDAIVRARRSQLQQRPLW